MFFDVCFEENGLLRLSGFYLCIIVFLKKIYYWLCLFLNKIVNFFFEINRWIFGYGNSFVLVYGRKVF